MMCRQACRSIVLLVPRSFLVVAAIVSLSAGCFTYAINVDEPSGEAIGIFAGLDVAAGLAIGTAMTLSDNSLGSIMEDLGAGVLSAFVVDLAIGLGVRGADFVGDARDPHGGLPATWFGPPSTAPR